MARARILRFIVSYIIVGVIVAVGVLHFAPGLLDAEGPTVQIRQAPTAADGERATGRGPISYADAVDKAAAAVVNVYSSKQITTPRSPFFDDPLLRRFFGDRFAPRRRIQTSLGSGVIVRPEGYVLTNYHVVEGATAIEVLLSDGRSARATVVGTDPGTDLAVLKIDLPNLPTIEFGSSADLRVGDVVLAIGNPFGVGQTVTQGIVSAKGRSELGLATFENFIQTDAAINPGNSGGALINARGELVGINTAIYSRTGGSLGIGFAIPIRLARNVLRSIIEHGRVIRGWIGVQVQNVTPRLARSLGLERSAGALIAGVLRGGPAARAGLRPGDLVRSINDKPVTSALDLRRLITAQEPGGSVRIEAVRGGQRFSTTVTIAERPPNPRGPLG